MALAAAAPLAIVIAYLQAGPARPAETVGSVPMWSLALGGALLTWWLRGHEVARVGPARVRVTVDLAVLVALLALDLGGLALLAWFAGVLASELTARGRRVVHRVVAVARSALGGAAVATALGVVPVGPTVGPEHAMLIAAVVAVDVALAFGPGSGLLRRGVRTTITSSAFGLAVGSVTAVHACALLAAVLVGTGAWEAALLLVPVLVALARTASAATRGQDALRRREQLFASATRCQRAATYEDAVAAVRAGATEATLAADVRVVEAEPARPSAAATLTLRGERRWLEAVPQPAGYGFLSGDRRALRDFAGLLGHTVQRIDDAAAVASAATTDALTGARSRAAWTASLREALTYARSDKHPVVLYVDLDAFKAINDTEGHAAGDEVLREVVRRLQGAVRETDVVGRLGGDEFAVLLHPTSDTQAPRLRAKVAEALEAVDADGRSTPGSVGIGWWSPGVSARALVERADRDMYRQKALRTGRDRAARGTAATAGAVVAA